MRIAVTGATGLIGRPLVRDLRERGHQVVVLTRRVENAKRVLGPDLETVAWGPAAGGDRLESTLATVQAVVNLAGESIASGRWTEERKGRIMDSRARGTRALVEVIAGLPRDQRPGVLVKASGVGDYGPRGQPVDESSPPGADFLARVCVAWENEAIKAEAAGVRTVRLRTGVVLGRRGGVLPLMLLPFKLYLGGPLGNGQQPFPWVHLDDVVGLYNTALTQERVSGPVNAVAPEVLTNREFSARLAESIGRPSWLPVPAVAIKLALGERSTLLLDGQNVKPVRALEIGYRFRFRTVDLALRDLTG
ncbi:MAG: TIGR01777 family oxidoreductase [Chloroflexi bacterium]|nr:TIGR01777 family oxidoreductase [Chloroflexota bacterium]